MYILYVHRLNPATAWCSELGHASLSCNTEWLSSFAELQNIYKSDRQWPLLKQAKHSTYFGKATDLKCLSANAIWTFRCCLSCMNTFHPGNTLFRAHCLVGYNVHVHVCSHITTGTVREQMVPEVLSGFPGESQHLNFLTVFTLLQPHTPPVLQYLHVKHNNKQHVHTL